MGILEEGLDIISTWEEVGAHEEQTVRLRMRQRLHASHVVSARYHVSRDADLGKGLEKNYWQVWEV